jgi:EF hand
MKKFPCRFLVHPGAVFIIGLAALSLPVQAQDGAPKNPPAISGARGGGAMPLDDLIKLLDKDHDGRISKEEATGIYAQRFSQWDANRDGYATRQEIHEYRIKLGIGDDGKPIGNRNQSGNGKPAGKEAVLIKEPADWRMESIPMPPGFAPGIKLKGSEEIRFAPGMFKNMASDYFTCIIGITAEGDVALDAAGLKDFL